MAGFVPKDKMSKKAQKELNSKRRVIWEVRPVTKTAAGNVRQSCRHPRPAPAVSGLLNGKKRLTDRGAPALS